MGELEKETRPWGSYTVLDEGDTYKVKRIEVLPDKRLSTQYHAHRAEHWVVVRGMGCVLVCELGEEGKCDEITLKTGDNIYIPKGHVHRLGNPFAAPLEIIEVQIGDYLGEDDIVRLADDYGRV